MTPGEYRRRRHQYLCTDSWAKPGPRKNGQNNSRRGGDRRTPPALSQRPKTMKAAHAPLPVFCFSLGDGKQNSFWCTAEHPTRHLSVRCAASRSERATCESLQRVSPTVIISATSATARLPSRRCKSERGHHDARRRFKVFAAIIVRERDETDASAQASSLRRWYLIPHPVRSKNGQNNSRRGEERRYYRPQVGGRMRQTSGKIT
jgi:hypothetical protein